VTSVVLHDQITNSTPNIVRIAIFGAGPAGFYSAEELLKHTSHSIQVDLFDRLPTPYGLVRGGVAPDHPKIKSIIKQYERIAQRPGFRFFGNVTFGIDLTLDEALAHYHQILFTTGAESDRHMDIPGEDLPGSYPATAFVGWYNGHPDFHHLHFNLSGTTSVVVIGNGNVAMDVTRILARSPNDLARTDITSYALATLQQSTVKEIIVCGRRGPAQAAFTNPELRELTELRGADLIVHAKDLTLDAINQRFLATHASEPGHQRNLEILKAQLLKGEGSQSRKIRMRFFTSPVAILGRDRVEGIRLEHNALTIDAQGNFIAQGTGRYEELPCQMVFRSIGYKGIPLPNVPFDKRKGVIPNRDGRVINPATNSPIPRLYVAGWIKRGPSGVIGTNKPDAAATVASMTIDMEEHRFLPIWADPDSIPALLNRKGIRYVTFADWQRIDNVEVANGQPVGKPREKLTTITAMLSAVRENT